MWTQFWQTSQQAANAWRTSPPRAAAPVRSLIQQAQPLPQSSAASHAQSGIPSIDVSRAALATPFTAASQSSRRAPLSARPAPLSFRSGEASAREQSQQAALGPSKPCVVFVLGGPGCGKGTQCSRIQEAFGWQHLSAGDLLREEVASGSEQGQMINTFIKDGKIVPVEVTVSLLSKAIFSSPSWNFLVDGFPRNMDNFNGWFDAIGDECDVPFALHFTCPQSVMEQRLKHRSETSGRVDDNWQSILKRFTVFEKESLPVIQLFKDAGRLLEIDATPHPDQVFADVARYFDALAQAGQKSQVGHE